MRTLALPMLQSGRLSIAEFELTELALPVRFLKVFGASPAELAAVTSAAHGITVHCGYRPDRAMAHEWVARDVAAGIAASIGGTLDVPADMVDRWTDALCGRAWIRPRIRTARRT